MEGDSTYGTKEIIEFIEYYEHLEDFKVDEKEWSFNGLIYLIQNKDDAATLKTKPILLDVIDLLQGKDRNKILLGLAKKVVDSDVRHRIFKWRR